MKVLFVSSGTRGVASPIILNQLNSLKKQGVFVDLFLVQSKGLHGYLKSLPRLSSIIYKSNFDVIHAHYSFCGYLCSLAVFGQKKVFCSLMGSDLLGSMWRRRFLLFFARFFWSTTIVKSVDMKDKLGLEKIQVIPNGVDLNKFKPLNLIECRKALNWKLDEKIVLFAADPNRPVKNYKLSKESIDILNSKTKVKLVCLKNIPNDDIPIWLNASDVILLTSLWEGSPNVIKEALACNRPIVCTDVGDVRERLQDVRNSYTCDFNSKNISKSLEKALRNGTSNGRESISFLDEANIAKKLLKLYSA